VVAWIATVASDGTGELSTKEVGAPTLNLRNESEDELAVSVFVAEVGRGLFGPAQQPIKLGRYVLVERIGAGGGGEVYAGYDPELDRRVAVKLHQRGEGAAKASEDRLLREAQAMAKLAHPNVVTVYDVGTYDGTRGSNGGVYIVMEFLEGSNLAQWLKAKRRSWSEVLDAFLAAGRGLAAAHQQELVHRDFKPSNVFVGDDGRVRVLDFGLARLAGRADSPASGDPAPPSEAPRSSSSPRLLGTQLTHAGDVVGTPPYMAPEQHRALPGDARTDQYSFCVALYEGLYGKRPFRGNSFDDILRQKLDGVPDPPPDRRDVPSQLRDLIRRGLQPDPERRFASMSELVRALERVGRNRRIGRVAFAVVGLVAMATLGVVARDGYLRSQCEQQADAIEEVWNEDVRTRLRAAFANPDISSYIEDSHGFVDAALADYATSWAKSRGEACRRAKVEGSLDADGLAMSEACLGLGRVRLSVVTDVLSDGSNETLEQAVDIVAELEPPGLCLDAEVARQRWGRIDASEPARRLEEKLIRVEVLRGAHALDEAKEIAQSVRDEAVEQALVGVRARATTQLGLLASTDGDPRTAVDTLHRARVEAESAGDERALAVATGSLISALTDVARHDEALRLAEMAAARLARVPSGDLTESQLAHAIAYAEVRSGRFEEAKDWIERALAANERALGPEHPTSARLYTAMGNILTSLRRWDDAKPIFAKAGSLAERAYGPQHPSVGIALLNQGRMVFSADPQQAAARFERALRILEGSLGRDHPRVGDVLSNLGAVAMREGEIEQAADRYREALEIHERAFGGAHPSVAQDRASLANVARVRGDAQSAVEEYRRAVEILEATVGQDHEKLSSVLAGLADALADTGQQREALEVARRCVNVRRASFGPDAEVTAVALNRVGVFELQLGEVDAAVKTLQDAVAILERRGKGSSDALTRARKDLQRARDASEDPKTP
jgi:tetratricopeptide (TPR) repeat protein